MRLRRGQGRVARAGVLLSACLLLAGCGAGTTPASPAPRARTYRMGFSAIPPRNDQAVAIQAIDIWSRRADAAIISLEPPWAEMLAGIDPATLVSVVQVPLANYYRSKGH